MTVVTDTSILTYLDQLGRLDLLDVFDAVVVPSSVSAELAMLPGQLERVLEVPNIIVDATPIIQLAARVQDCTKIDPGEEGVRIRPTLLDAFYLSQGE